MPDQSGPIPYRLTHTKIQVFDRCRKQFWFRYVSKLPWPEEDESVPLIVGKAVHVGMKALCDTGDPADGANQLDLYLRMPKHAAAGPGTDGHALATELYAKGCEAHASIDSVDRFAELDTWVFSRGRGLSVQAIADRADLMADGSWQLIDWKTGLADRDDVTDAQLDIGHLAVRTTRRLPREANVSAIGWNLRRGEKRIRALTRDDAVATMDRLSRLADRIQSTTEFPASPSPSCRWCSWRPQCPEAEYVEGGDYDWYDTESPQSL